MSFKYARGKAVIAAIFIAGTLSPLLLLLL